MAGNLRKRKLKRNNMKDADQIIGIAQQNIKAGDEIKIHLKSGRVVRSDLIRPIDPYTFFNDGLDGIFDFVGERILTPLWRRVISPLLQFIWWCITLIPLIIFVMVILAIIRWSVNMLF